MKRKLTISFAVIVAVFFTVTSYSSSNLAISKSEALKTAKASTEQQGMINVCLNGKQQCMPISAALALIRAGKATPGVCPGDTYEIQCIN